jgi:hypothetical protein
MFQCRKFSCLDAKLINYKWPATYIQVIKLWTFCTLQCIWALHEAVLRKMRVGPTWHILMSWRWRHNQLNVMKSHVSQLVSRLPVSHQYTLLAICVSVLLYEHMCLDLKVEAVRTCETGTCWSAAAHCRQNLKRCCSKHFGQMSVHVNYQLCSLCSTGVGTHCTAPTQLVQLL